MEERKSYLGTGWRFPPAFIKHIGTVMVSDEDDIRQSLEILLSTSPGERIFHSDYGCNIRRWMFGNITLTEKTLIADSINDAILFYEPRITVETVEVNLDEGREGILWINIAYRIIQTNSRSNMVYPFYFKEGTNL